MIKLNTVVNLMVVCVKYPQKENEPEQNLMLKKLQLSVG